MRILHSANLRKSAKSWQISWQIDRFWKRGLIRQEKYPEKVEKYMKNAPESEDLGAFFGAAEPI